MELNLKTNLCIDRHSNEDIGVWDTTVKRKEYDLLFANQQSTMEYDGEIYSEENKYQYEKSDKSQIKYTDKPQKQYVTDRYTVKTKPENSVIKSPKKAEFDVSWVDIGAEVYHEKFGLGIIVSVKNGLLNVKFSTGEKRFQYPTAFENGFLSKPGD